MTIDVVFSNRLEATDSIFGSYVDLYSMYQAAMKGAGVPATTLAAFSRVENSSLHNEQDRISRGLYTQGFVLMTGTAEALIKDVFKSLLIENIPSVKDKSINFSLKDVQEVLEKSEQSGMDTAKHIGYEFGKLAYVKKFGTNTKNPSEKLNFQNIKTMIGVFESYFGITIPESSTTEGLHRDWQIRHIIIHNDAVIDKQFIHNVKAVGLLLKGEKEGKKIVVTKKEYEESKERFLTLFTNLSMLIKKSSLESKFVRSTPQR